MIVNTLTEVKGVVANIPYVNTFLTTVPDNAAGLCSSSIMPKFRICCIMEVTGC
jgi:hypothetical protein